MRKSLSRVIVFALIVVVNSASVAQQKSLDIYMVRGMGAKSVLDHPTYRTVFTNSIFKDHDVNIDLEKDKAYFLKNLFESDIIYCSLHSNPQKLVVANGDVVTPQDILDARGQNVAKPKLVVITGCETLRDEDKMSFPDAFGIVNGSKDKRAYIGFKTITVGFFCDRFFRAFFALWMAPKPDGSYRTLLEAKSEAQAKLTHILDLKGMGKTNVGAGTRDANREKGEEVENTAAEPSSIGSLDPDVADWFSIVGNPSLKLSDLLSN